MREVSNVQCICSCDAIATLMIDFFLSLTELTTTKEKEDETEERKKWLYNPEKIIY